MGFRELIEIKPAGSGPVNDRECRFIPSENAVNVFHDYYLQENIRESAACITYAAGRAGNEKAYVINILKDVYPSPSAIAIFRKESSLIEALGLDAVVQSRALIEIEGMMALVMDAWGDCSVREALGRKPELRQFLLIALSLASTLGNLHQNGIIFRDINPDNILVEKNSGEVKLANFGLESILIREQQTLVTPFAPAENLVYLSPEQTGRMNVSIDHRSDLYSLGVVFYELLTGNLPFQAAQLRDSIHNPPVEGIVPPCRKRPDIPEVISRIIMKLLAKNPDERYQNAFGLLADLRKCYSQFMTYGDVKGFTIGKNDIPIKFIVPKMLVGREKEKHVLLEAYEKVKHGANEIVLISGGAGTGKTSIVNEIASSIIHANGFFISGKCDQYVNDAPYGALIQAFTGLVRQILSEGEEKIQLWRENLLEALEPNAKLMTDMIPLLERVIGKPPEIGQINDYERRLLFDSTAKKFIKLFATKTHPLTIFLDDLQWIDRPSLDLTAVIDQSIRHFFFIGAFRDNEVDEAHHLAVTIEKTMKHRELSILRLQNLNRDDMQKFLNGFFENIDRESEQHINELIWEKTAGNPFFIHQWLNNLYEARILFLDPHSGWQWDLEKIRKTQISDNVLALLENKIERVPDHVKETLKICACLGSSFDLDSLVMVLKRPVSVVVDALSTGADAGFVAMKGRKVWFQHDQIREAIYTSIPEPENHDIHYRIGKAFLESSDDAQRQEKLFYIADQFDQAHSLIKDPSECLRLAELSLEAGLKARDSSAFTSALRYFERGSAFLPENSWIAHYGLTFNLKKNLAKCAYITGNHDEAGLLFNEIMCAAQTDYDRAEIYIIRILLLTNKGKYEEALNLGLDALAMVGCRLPRNPGKLAILIEFFRIKRSLRNKAIESVLDLPVNRNQAVHSAVRVIESMAQAVAYTNLNLRILMTIRCMNLIIRHGHSYISPYITAAMVPIICSARGEPAMAREFISITFSLMDEVNARNKGQSYFMLAYCALQWQNHARDCIEYFRKAQGLLRDVGSFNFACHSINNIIDYSFIIGRNLDESFTEYKRYEEFIRGLKDPFFTDYFTDNMRKYDCLQGRTDSPTTLDRGDGYEARRREILGERKNDLDSFSFNCNKIKLLYLYGKIEEAYGLAEQCAYLIKRNLGLFLVPEFVFYHALCAAAVFPKGTAEMRRKIKVLLKKFSKRMKKWADNCPENFKHKYLLIEAERKRIAGKEEETAMLYKRAIRSAADAGYVNNEGVISERLAGYFLELSKTTEAAAMIREAYACFESWGAFAKLRDLETHYEDCLIPIQQSTGISFFGERRKSGPQNMDLATVIKASQAIAGEISYSGLLERLVKIIIENAGAQKGVVILRAGDCLFVEAEGSADRDAVEVLQSIPVDEHEGLSPAIVHYVAMTHEVICLDRAFSEGRFVHDPYLLKNEPKSVLCSPILNKGVLVGILYLENNLAEGVFTQERIDVLNILSSQIAISMDNAKIYGQLEEKVRERTKDLQNTVRELNMEVNRCRNAQEELRVSHYRLAKVLDSTTDTIIVVNQGHTVTFFNKGAEELFLYKARDILGEPVKRLMSEDEQALFEEKVRSLGDFPGTGGKTDPFVMTLEARNGRRFQVRMALAVFTIEGEPFYSLILKPADRPDGGALTEAGIAGSKQAIPMTGDFFERFSALEDALKDISHQLAPHSFEDYQLREMTARVMGAALSLWERETEKSKIELAEESGLWKAYCDYGTWRTRTLDKYLSPETLPHNPRYADVVKTVDFVLSCCPQNSDGARELNNMLREMKDSFERIDIRFG